MAIKTDFVPGRELKVGSVFIGDDGCSFYKLSDVTTSKPGKHGSAKSVITAKNLVTGKNLTATFKDEKIIQVTDFDYKHKPIYNYTVSNDRVDVCVDLVGDVTWTNPCFSQECQPVIIAMFNEHDKKVKSEQVPNGKIACLKYSEYDEPSTTKPYMVCWEIVYLDPSELPRCGINDYVE